LGATGTPVAPGVLLAFAGCVAVALLASGCGVGLGPGERVGEAELTVTRDFGAEPVAETEATDLVESDTVMRVLDRQAEIETRYGGGFVHSIEGLPGGRSEGRSFDWFYFVNGIEADRGGGEYGLDDGDRIWWDYRDWGAALGVPAVVGQFPEPFVNGYDEAGRETVVECFGAGSQTAATCTAAERALRAAGAEVAEDPAGADDPGANDLRADGDASDAIRVLVGPWAAMREDPDAASLAHGPERSGVYARFEGADSGGFELVALDARGEEVERPAAGVGLVAATRRGGDAPTWILTGGDSAAVAAAVAALDPETLAHRYAALADGARTRSLPLP